MKKIILINCIFILMFSLTACISETEKKQGKEEVKSGEILIKEYVRQTYGEDARVSDIKPCYIDERNGSTVPNFNKITSGYVKAAISDHTTFDMLYNINTNEVLTKENIGTVEDSFLSYAKEVLQINLIDCGISVYSTAIDDPYIAGFIEPGIMTYKELVSTGKYRIQLTYRCIDSDLDIITEDTWRQLTAPFLNEDTEGMVEMAFVNFNDKEGYEAAADQDFFFYIDGDTPYYASEKAGQYAKNVIYINQKGDKIKYLEN